MTTKELQAQLDAHTQEIQRRIEMLIKPFVAEQVESNRLQAESEARCKAADERTAKREAAYDERVKRAEAMAERNCQANEMIGNALNSIATDLVKYGLRVRS